MMHESPPYTDFGSEEDSLCSYMGLLPKPPRRDFIKVMEKHRLQIQCSRPRDHGAPHHEALSIQTILISGIKLVLGKYSSTTLARGFRRADRLESSYEWRNSCKIAHGLDSNVLHFICRLDTTKPVNTDRRFILSYFLSDDTVSVLTPA